MLLRSSSLVLATAGALVLSSCGDSGVTSTSASQADDAVSAVVGFYPYEFVTERVGGPDVDVTNLTEPGGEPHDLELTPRQVGAVGEADLVVFSAGFQPAVDEAVEQQADDRALDVLSVVEAGDAEGHGEQHGDEPHAEAASADEVHAEHAGGDPHVWLDPALLGEVATAVADRLAEVDPDGASGYASRAEELVGELATLDDDLRAGLATCERREVVTSHDAFGHLADAYDLEQVPIAGLSPDDEASPRRLREVAAQAEAAGVTTIFFEELVSPKVAESLAREVGASAEVLSTLEGPPETGDYLTAMRENLERLRRALGCS
jgi:zinc transport system substrate-binding protein